MIPGVILAGGASRRMGGRDKALLPLGGRPMIAHVLAGLDGQCAPLAINANGDPARFAEFGLPVLPDSVPDRPGPLAGVLAAMRWAAGMSADRVVTAPADTPFPRADLVARLADGPGSAIAADDSGLHPVFGIWNSDLADDLQEMLEGEVRQMRAFADRVSARIVTWQGTVFDNINTPDDLSRVDAAIRSL